ncbi:MAG: polysaccharide deacetylase family protein [Clostridiales bacterium]|jgi:peptidoglycan-N-acetylmuramic acid deacetylase|nr:polysaccharide deacetylase family protein [Clostridiales bacterium]
MKNKNKGIILYASLLIAVVILIMVAVAILKQVHPSNASDSAAESLYATPVATSAPAQVTTPIFTPTSTFVPTPTIIPTPILTPTPVPTINIVSTDVSNERKDWYYLPANSLWTDTLPTTRADMEEDMKQYNGIWQQDTSEKVIYITMDMGENCSSNLDIMLDAAKSRGVKMTFFLVGNIIKLFPETVLKIESEGHLIANHTMTHPHPFTSYLDQYGEDAFWKQITDTEYEYKKLTGKDMVKIVRPPNGVYSEKICALTYNKGYRLALWSFGYLDWNINEQPEPVEALNKILSEACPGQVMLLHPKSTTNTEIFGELLDKLIERGYSFKTLDQFPEYK